MYQDQLKPVAELDSIGNVKRRYVYGLKENVPDYYEQNGLRYRTITDHLGSVRMVIKESTGDVVTQIEYDEYGKENVAVRDTSLSSMFFGYAGGLADTETGLVRFGARDYSSITGRWTDKDQILFEGGDYNLYGYVVNDPINSFDTNGNLSTTQFALIGFGISFSQSKFLEGDSWGKAILKGVGGGLAGGFLGSLGAGIKVSTQAKALLGGIGFLTGLASSAISEGDDKSARPFISATNTAIWAMLLHGTSGGVVTEAVLSSFIAVSDLLFQEFFKTFK